MATQPPKRTPTGKILGFAIVSGIFAYLILRLAIYRVFTAYQESIVLSIVGVLLFCTSLVFVLWFLARLLKLVRSFLHSGRFTPLSSAILAGAVLLLALLVLATPKVYNQEVFYGRGPVSVLRTRIVPLWHDPLFSKEEGHVLSVNFIGLNYSVIIAEIIASAAVAAIVWSLMKKTERKVEPAVRSDSE